MLPFRLSALETFELVLFALIALELPPLRILSLSLLLGILFRVFRFSDPFSVVFVLGECSEIITSSCLSIVLRLMILNGEQRGR